MKSNVSGSRARSVSITRSCAYFAYTSVDTTSRQDSGSWVYKAEWNGTISDKLYVEARYGDVGYYFPLISNGSEEYFWRDTGLQVLTGSQQRWQIVPRFDFKE